jgi:lipoate-protein ligase A
LGTIIWNSLLYSFGWSSRWGYVRCGSGFNETYRDRFEDFIKSIRSKVTEGTSALFLMTSDAVEDRVVEAMNKSKFEIIATNLSKEEEEQIRATFAEE